MNVALSPLAGAVGGVADPVLRAVVADHWDHAMQCAPLWATTLGDHRFDDQLAPRDAASIAAAARDRAALLARLSAIDPARLGEADRVTLALLHGQLEAEREVDACRMHEWQVEAGAQSAFSELSYLVALHPVTAPEDAANLVARLTQGERLIDDTIANLARGLGDGRVTSAEKLRRAIEQLDGDLAQPVDSWAMAAPAWATPPAFDPWPAGERERQIRALRDVVATQLQPALTRLRDFLRDRLYPAARTEREGLCGLPDGARCYRALIRQHTDLSLSPDELHAIGEAEVARTDAELAALGRTALDAPDLAATLAALRGDRSLYFVSRAQLLGAAQIALYRAKAALRRAFAIVPSVDCVLREVPEHEARHAPVAYYLPPHADGAGPGEYVVNTFAPQTQPRFELEALTWHEAVPGRHLQVALAQQLGPLPAFRKYTGSAAFTEGWALYAELLADELGLYSSELDRLGMLGFDAWRSARLVVDTGLHARGWSRRQAEAYLHDHTALAPASIVNEVDRYLHLPGEALACKVGQRAILRLRAEAEAALGPTFDLKEFHAVVLGAGTVSLPVLADRIEAWIAEHMADLTGT